MKYLVCIARKTVNSYLIVASGGDSLVVGRRLLTAAASLAGHRLLSAAASLVAGPRLQAQGASVVVAPAL